MMGADLAMLMVVAVLGYAPPWLLDVLTAPTWIWLTVSAAAVVGMVWFVAKMDRR